MNLLFPARGIDKQFGFERQPPYSSPLMQNVRPFDVIEGRGRGGSRPGLRKAAVTLLGSGAKVNLLSSVSRTDSSGFTQFSENFQVTSLADSGWTAVSAYSADLPSIYDSADAAVVYENDTAKAGGALTALVPTLDVTSAYTVELVCVPYLGTMGGNYTLWAGLSDTTPNPFQDGLLATLTMVDATASYSGNMKHYKAGVLQNTYTFTGLVSTDNAKARKLWFLISGGTVKVYVDGTLEVNQSLTLSAPTTSFKRVGFGIEATVENAACMIESFVVQYYTASITERERTILMAASNGILYRETYEGVMEAVSSNLTLHATNRLRATELLGKLYIADHGEIKATGTNGALTSGVLDSATYADWTTLGLNTYDYVVVITAGTGATVNGTYTISTIHATNGLTLGVNPGDGTCTFSVQRGPKIYDPVANTLALWTTTAALGQVPTGATLIATYRGRILMGGGRLWYMSRQYNALDWNYGASDIDFSRAVAGQNAEAGQLGQPLTALIPHNDDYVIFASGRQIYVLRGDPTYDGASLGPLSQSVGIVGGDAMCETDDGTLVFLATSGVYAIAAGGVGRPQMLSRSIPRSLINLLDNQFQVSMAFDARDEGVHVFIHQEGVVHTQYWMDMRTNGFFPVKVSVDHVPYSMYVNGTAIQNTSDVILGCDDGYLRRFSEFDCSDDGTEIESFVEIGPIQLGDGKSTEGIVKSIAAILDEESGTVNWSMRVGNSGQAAFLADTLDSGTWDNDEGFQLTEWSNARGFAAIVRLDNADITPWAMESVVIQVQSLDLQRIL